MDKDRGCYLCEDGWIDHKLSSRHLKRNNDMLCRFVCKYNDNDGTLRLLTASGMSAPGMPSKNVYLIVPAITNTQ